MVCAIALSAASAAPAFAQTAPSPNTSNSGCATCGTPPNTPQPGSFRFFSNVGGGVNAGGDATFGSYNSSGVLVADPNGRGTSTIEDDKLVTMKNVLTVGTNFCTGPCGVATLDAQVASTGMSRSRATYTTTTPGMTGAVANTAFVASANQVIHGVALIPTTTTPPAH